MSEPVTEAQRIALAAVAGAHGVKGEVRLKLFADSVDSLAIHENLLVGGEARKLQSIRDGGKDVYAYFRHDEDGSNALSAMGLRDLLA